MLHVRGRDQLPGTCHMLNGSSPWMEVKRYTAARQYLCTAATYCSFSGHMLWLYVELLQLAALTLHALLEEHSISVVDWGQPSLDGPLNAAAFHISAAVSALLARTAPSVQTHCATLERKRPRI